MNMRSLMVIVLYAVIGTAFTVAGYRIALGGEVNLPGMDKALDGSVIFLSIVIYTAMAYAAAAVLLALMSPSGVSPNLAVLVSALVTGVIGFGMMAWFPGLTVVFPIVMACGGVVCASTANLLGLFQSGGK